MANALDTTFVNLANSLLTQFGKSITLRTIAEGSYNPASGDVSKTPTDTTIKARVDEFSSYEIDSNIIEVGDVKVIIEGVYTFDKSDNLIIDSEIYDIINIKKIYAVEEIPIYEVQARKNGTTA
ncbi:MAG: hypothetical protein R3254_12155 [Thiomicrorhabdus sp.]|nr:hypothetical protein [Thiomicrorhabdus sp.]